MKPLVELLKLRITVTSTVTTVVGYVMFRGMFDWPLALVAGGILLQACGAAALNQVQDAAVDAKMDRTATRPIPSGRVPRPAALVYSLALLAAGSVLLGSVSILAAAVGLAARHILLQRYPTAQGAPWIADLASRISIASVLLLFVIGAVLLYRVEAPEESG